jgi:hypothetical protein
MMGKPKGKRSGPEPGVDVWVLLICECGFGFFWLGIGISGGGALLNTVMKLGVPKAVGISCLAQLLLAAQEGVCSVKFGN